MALTWLWIMLIAFIVCSLLHTLLLTSKKKKKTLPPGPKPVPILGHLHMLGKNPHQDLHEIAKRYGSIVYMKLGLDHLIVISSPDAAQLFLKTHDHIFASRPPHQGSKYLAYDQRNLTFGTYGKYWRNMRKLCTLELLTSHKISSFRSMRREVIGLFVESLERASRERAAVDLSAKITSLTAEMSCRMVFGKKYEDNDIDERGFKAVIQETMKLGAAPNLGDFFPLLGILDLQGLTRRLKALAKVYDKFFEKIIDAHVSATEDARGETTKDVVQTMLSVMQSGDSEFQFDRRHIKAIMLDMLAASMDTTGSTIEWVLSELIKNPNEMKKVQKELEQVVGLNRTVEESDLDKLEYLDMVIKETFRLHPVAPLLLPHCSTEDCNVNGYHIPKGSRIFINAYAIGRDPNTWSNPDKFIPERFVGSDVDVRGKHFQLIPFGSGRRGCPGIALGLLEVRLIVAQAVHCFDWELPNGAVYEDLDMTEEFGLVVARAEHLVAVPSLRLSCDRQS